MTVDVRLDVDVRTPEPPARARPGPRRRASLRHEPALDGLRGLAIAVVVVFHLDRLQGGFLGVDLFFVLSGYLITSLLLAEHHRTGAIGLGGFWARRARRLLPALFVVLVGVGALLLFFTPEGQRSGFRGDALATLGYVANWHRMLAEVGYWDMFSQPSPLDHMWSLAIEEQFYVLWPIVALLVLGRGAVGGGRSARRLAVVSLAGAAVSFVLLALTYSAADTNRAYFATDTRIGPTLLGAALAAFTAARGRAPATEATPAAPAAATPAALTTPAAPAAAPATATPATRGGTPGRRAAGVAGPVALAAGVLALAWMAWSVWQVDGVGAWYYRGGLVTFAVAAAVVIHLVTGGRTGPLATAVSWAPLRGLGTISYGVYLWHWPVIVYVTPSRAHVDGLALDALRVALTLAVSVASFVLIERPIRRGSFDAGRLRVVGAGAFAVTLVAVVVATSGPAQAPVGADAPPEDLSDAFDPRNEWARTHRHLPENVPPGTPKLLVVGDSGVAKVGRELVRQGQAAGVSVAFSSEGFCSAIFPDDVSLSTNGHVWKREFFCSESRQEIWRALIDRFDPDVVVHYLANAGTWFKQRVDGEWVWDCDEPYDSYLRDALGEDLALLGEGGATVLFATSPYVNPDFDQRDPTSDERVDCRNDTYRAVVEGVPGAAMVDLNAFVESQRDEVGSGLMVDDVHLDEEGIRRVSAWLLQQTTPEAIAALGLG